MASALARPVRWPLGMIDVEVQPPIPGALSALLEWAAAQRPEVALAREAVAAAQDTCGQLSAAW